MSTTGRPAHRMAADPAAPLRVSLSIKVSAADKAAYVALPPLARAAVRAQVLATLRAALAQEEGTR